LAFEKLVLEPLLEGPGKKGFKPRATFLLVLERLDGFLGFLVNRPLPHAAGLAKPKFGPEPSKKKQDFW
jgi:hypothetical protein